MTVSNFLVAIDTDASIQPTVDFVYDALTGAPHYSNRVNVTVERYDRQPAREAESVTAWKVVTQTVDSPIRQSLVAQFVTLSDATAFVEAMPDNDNVAIVHSRSLR